MITNGIYHFGIYFDLHISEPRTRHYFGLFFRRRMVDHSLVGWRDHINRDFFSSNGDLLRAGFVIRDGYGHVVYRGRKKIPENIFCQLLLMFGLRSATAHLVGWKGERREQPRRSVAHMQRLRCGMHAVLVRCSSCHWAPSALHAWPTGMHCIVPVCHHTTLAVFGKK